MSNIFRNELRPATEQECKARWSCAKPGENFRCGFCGHKFQIGDLWRGLYTNDMAHAGGNPLVCECCNADNESLRKDWLDKCVTWKAFINEPTNWFLKTQIVRAAQ